MLNALQDQVPTPDLVASRARIAAAADEERRRLVRDLHDGAQPHLVHTIITLKLALRALEDEDGDVSALVAAALEHAERATAELRELARGILPSALVRNGLRAGVHVLAARSPIPVAIDMSLGRLPATAEATAYFVIAEALTNVVKHSHAQRATVSARIADDVLLVDVSDDGVGGARLEGSGLVGLCDRLAAVEGILRLVSPPDGGTILSAAIPLARWTG
jgi:signal transduction histidine kinase